MRSGLFSTLCLLALSVPASASAEIFAAAEAHASVLSDVPDRSVLASTFGGGIRGGYRWESGWGAYLHLEQNLWLASETSGEVVDGAWNIGVGGELLYADGFVHTALAVGPAILAFDTVLDRAGSTGLFLDVRPVGLRWAVHEWLRLGLDPIAFALVAPVLEGIPLIQIEYRTVLYAEVVF